MTQVPLQGVNLGGWLVLEKWMTPRLFEGTRAVDEYTFMKEPGAEQKITRHRRTFITEADFKWLADNGLTAVRIPIGYWLFERDGPYMPMVEYLDWAVEMAEKYQLKVLIDLHGVPGSQNGKDHSGRVGKVDWYRNKQYRDETIETLEKIAKRYYDAPSVWGIELMNEPKFGMFQWKLRRFYDEAYQHLVKVARPGTRIVFHDAFTPRLLSGALRTHASHPVIMDVHWYHFGDWLYRWRPLGWYFYKQHHRKWLVRWLQSRQPIIVGEWSLVISDKMTKRYAKEKEWELFRRHGEVQLELYEQTAGWFYWTYKTEDRGIWHFRSMVEDGVISLAAQR